MPISEAFAGVQQADVASLTYGGITYQCFVWVSAPNDAGPQRVEAAICADGEDGQLVLVDFSIVAEAVDDLVDCPRVLAVEASNIFVIHWIDAEKPADDVLGAALFRSLFDVTAISAGWDPQGSVALHESLLYDHATIIDDADDEFVVTRRTAADTIQTTRFTAPFSWTDTVWVSSETGLTIDDTILGCHADSTGDTVVYSYADGVSLYTTSLAASDGTINGSVETFDDLPGDGEQYTAVSHKRFATDLYLVAAEANTEDNITAADGVRQYLRFVVSRVIRGDSAEPQYSSQRLWNLHLESRLWVWPSGVTGELEVYSGWGFKSIPNGREFNQLLGGVIRYAVHEYATADALTVRPIPASIQVNGTWDARPHGSSPAALVSIGKRLNHLSHVTPPPQYALGPNGKSVLFAHTRWGRLAAAENDAATELQPVEASIAWHRFYHEPPWTVRRSALEATQPDLPAFRGLAPTHNIPVETPAGLVWTGGVTSTYDGRQVTELGWMWGAEILSVTAIAMGGAMDDPETYHWTVVPIWIDRRGNAHRGPPSVPVAVALVANGYARLRIRCINLSLKDDRVRYLGAPRIYFEIYRTTAPGGTFERSGGLYLFRSEFGGSASGYRIHDLPYSDPAEPYITVDVGRPNSVVQYNQLSPWQLDLDSLLWSPPPPIPHQPLDIACCWQNRLFGVDPEGLLRWSEEILPRGADLRKPEFLDTNVMRLAGVGHVTGLAPFENDLAVLARDSLHAIAGDPGAGGSGNTFQLRALARGVGCIEPRSIAVWPDGFTFQSAKRIHVGTRSSGIEDIGATIEDTIRDAGNVRSAIYLDDREELSFTFAARPGTAPLSVRPREARFNLRTKAWTFRRLPLSASVLSVSRLNEPMHACSWRALSGETLRVVLLQGAILRERSSTDTVYSDEAAAGSQSIRLDVTTEWITMGSPDSTKRFPEIGIITERFNDGPITIESWYDHDGSFDSDSGASEHTLTVSSPAPAMIRFRPVPPKCRAIKLRIFEPNSAPSTRNLRFVALVVHWMLIPRRQGSRNNASAT